MTVLRFDRQLRDLLRDPALARHEIVSEGVAERGFTDFRPAHGTIGQHIADRGSRVTELAKLAQVKSRRSSTW